MGPARLLPEIANLAPSVPVVVTAQAGSVKEAVEAMQSGAVDYLLKPFHPDTLVLAVQKALAEPAPSFDTAKASRSTAAFRKS